MGEIIKYRFYKGEEDLATIISLIEKDLSEPYSVYLWYLTFIEDIISCIVKQLYA